MSLEKINAAMADYMTKKKEQHAANAARDAARELMTESEKAAEAAGEAVYTAREALMALIDKESL